MGSQTDSGSVNSLHTPPPVAAAAASHNTRVLRYLVNGIIENARWPSSNANLKLCVAGSPALADNLQYTPLQNRYGTVVSQSINPQELAATLQSCSVLFIGQDTPQEIASQWVVSLHKWAIVTIWENPYECSSGTMICLYTSPAKIPTFDVNLDSVSRSGVVLNPMVLTLTNHMPSDLLPATNSP
ncbi:YfiR family protein [Lampropedia aestuarii]|uniref:YfiR family protein n=1 Tax=Lampropedia aestuarii TaxID=2562762 RepID=UPI002468CCE7|nr:YfiR family protein [Lampropedia aestuarii]MDH5855933.1 YfiR family protein [Lampropedia aestuarii]